jgi:hypothetical protein
MELFEVLRKVFILLLILGLSDQTVSKSDVNQTKASNSRT